MKHIQAHGYPTVLVAHDDQALRSTLAHCLRREGYHVLEAHHWTNVFDFLRVHSRPIHLLLVDVNQAEMVPMLKPYQSRMRVLFVNKPVDADDVLPKVRQLLGSPPSQSSIR
jgi:DNA-binding response OmpR family regulator